MLNPQEFKDIVVELRAWGLDVFPAIEDKGRITYRTEEFPNLLLHVQKYNDTYDITTFFGKSTCEGLEDLMAVIQLEWDKDNWFYGVDSYGEYIELRVDE